MTTLSIQPPFPLITDIDGQPLEDGYIWIGAANLPPIGNPVAVYWDAALTQPAALPVRTRGGYPVNNGTPARLYVGSDYSILVQNKNGSTIYSAPAATERYSDPVITGVSSAEVSFLQAGAGAVTRTAQSKMRDVVSVRDFGAVGDGATDDTAAIQAALTASVGGGEVYFPKGTYKVSSTLTLTDSVKLRGVSMFGSELAYAGSGVAILIPSASGRNVISDMTVSGTSKTGTGVQIGDTNFSGQHVLERVRIRQFSTGLRLAGALWTSVLQCFISSNATGVDFNAGWSAGYSTTVLFVGCRISGNDYEGVNASYVPVRNQSITFIGGSIEYNCSADLTRYQHVTGTVQQLSLINVYYESSGVTKPNGLNLQLAGPFTIQDCFFNSLNYGIYATTASRGRIDGCRFISIDAKDIFLSGGVNVNNIEIGTSNEFSAAGNTLAGANVIAYTANKPKAQQIETNTTFTPTIRGASTAGTPTYTLQSGSYSKVGNLVCFKVRVSISNKGGMVGMISIEGLPIAAAQLIGSADICSMDIAGATLSASNTYFYAQIDNNSTSIRLYQGGSTSNSQLVDSQLANSTTVLVSGCYQAAS